MPLRDDSPEARNAARAAGHRKEQPASETPEQRALRVARLRKEVADGTYKADARKLAARIVEAHLERER